MLEGTEAETMDGTNAAKRSADQADRSVSKAANARRAGAQTPGTEPRLELLASHSGADVAVGDPRLSKSRLTPTAASHGA